MSNPNLSFTKVENATEALSDLQVSDAKVSNLVVENDVIIGGSVQQGKVQKATVTGWLPSVLPVTVGAYSLLNVAGAGAAATVATDGRLVTIPAGAVVTSVRYVGVGGLVAAGTTFDIGVGALNTDAAPMVPELITAGTPALAVTVAGTAVVGANRDLVGAIATATGTAATAVTDTAGSNHLNVSVIGASVTVGNLRVEVDYVLSV